MRKAFILIFIFLSVSEFISITSAQSIELDGTWKIDSVQVKKVVNGEINNRMCGIDDNFSSFTPCPSRIIFKKDDVTFEYKDGHKNNGTYKRISSKQMEIMFSIASLKFDYQLLKEDAFRIDYVIDYVIDGVKDARDEYKYYGHKE